MPRWGWGLVSIGVAAVLLWTGCEKSIDNGEIARLRERIGQLEERLHAYKNPNEESGFPGDPVQRPPKPEVNPASLENVTVTPDLKAHIEKFLEPGPGLAIADVGCGSGRHTFWMAEAVGPTGVVYAVDVSEKALQALHKRMKKEASPLHNVIPVYNVFSNVMLPPESVDLALLSDVHFHNPEQISDQDKQMIQSLWLAMRRGGRLLVLENADPRQDPRAEVIRKHYESVGFATKEVLEKQEPRALYVLFEKPRVEKHSEKQGTGQ